MALKQTCRSRDQNVFKRRMTGFTQAASSFKHHAPWTERAHAHPHFAAT
jgi:hypothetical protein